MMKVIVLSHNDVDLKSRYYQDRVKIAVDGKVVFDVYDGEPEDNNLCRNFNDVLTIPSLMRQAYEAGRKGEELEFEDGYL